MNRRQFLKWAIAAVGAGATGTFLGTLLRTSCPVTLLGLSDPNRDISPEIAKVFLEDGLNLQGKVVLIKPNFVEYHPQRPINTDVNVIRQVAEACYRLGAREVGVGEAAGHRRDPYFSAFNPLLRAALDKRVKLYDLNHGDVVTVPNRGRYTKLEHFHLPARLAAADVLINMPKLKTHHWVGVTLSLKNLFGTLPGIIYGWPKNILHFQGIERSILDLALSVKVDYVVVDGVVGMEGDGPILGTPRPVGMLAMGRYPLAVDATCARIMGFDPWNVQYLGMAGWKLPGLAAGSIVHRGEHPRRFATRFSCLPNFQGLQGGPFWS